MAKKHFGVILPLLILLLIESGCTHVSPLVGKWQDNASTDTWEFTKTGNVIIVSQGDVITGTYKLVSGDVVNLILQGNAGLVTLTGNSLSYQFTISGNEMNFVGEGNTTVLDKVK
jgi:hypothetical protein